MEQLLHYVWKHKIFPLHPLLTTDGRSVEVVDAGLDNHDAGPDFFNARIKIGGTLWVGNVEIHDRASDWYAQGHDHDKNYDNVILHVVGDINSEALTTTGRKIAQLRLDVPSYVRENYAELLRTDSYPPCYRIVGGFSPLTVHSWMAALETERLERKTDDIRARAERMGSSWEDAYFITLAHNYGFGINGDAFERWAMTMPLSAAARHRDDLFQVEAIFLGQAGLLSADVFSERKRVALSGDRYFSRLSEEYRYMRHKFNLTPMDCREWRFLRLRPQNFPHIRLSQLAMLYHKHRTGLSQLTACATIKELSCLYDSEVSPYWQTHYSFGSPSRKSAKRLSSSSINLLIINTAIPMLFAYGRHTTKEYLCRRAVDFLEELKAEDNYITRMWRLCGMDVVTAGDSQALIQLKKEYCDRRDCLRCRIGYEYLKKS